ncbi:MAG TPA: CHASE domain-containing protein [Pyrinomonadaceae bacterium]|jgi:PAS domain S-box-containing protein|nr:CHASE domain-containing protein [Pyrinomonadaceae bacterium]
MSSSLPKPRKPRALRVVLPYLILGLGLSFTFLVSFYFLKLSTAQDQARFNKSIQEIEDRIKARIQTSIALLHAGTGLFAASKEVDAKEFERFIQQIELQKNYPGIQGIGFSQRFLPEDRAEAIASMQRAGFRDFKIWTNGPDTPRDEYHAILYLQPLDNRNRVAIGYDMFTEPVRRQAMEAARDTGLLTASGRVVLVQETDPQKQSGFLIYAPVYKNGADVSGVMARRKALLGFVYSPFRTEDFLAPILSEKSFDVSFKIYDGENTDPDYLLHDSPNETSPPHLTKTDKLSIAGRNWTLLYATKPSFELASSRTFLPYTFGAGLLLSWLFFAVTRAEVHARARAERAAYELAKSEATTRQTLTERELAEDALRESEERYRELIENANDIVYMLDFDGRITSINKAAEIILGYTQDELLGMNITAVLASESLVVGEQMLTSGHQRTNYEVEVFTKNGRLLTLETSNKLITKSSQPVGIQGIARDISTRRRAEEALREADQRALSEYERLVERISVLAQALGAARELNVIFRALREFTNASVPCNGFFVSLYDPVQDVRTACYGWGDDKELDVSELPPMPVTSSGPNSRAVRTGQVIVTNDYMAATRGHPTVIVGPDNGLRPQSSMAVPMAVMGRIIGTIEVQSYNANVYHREHETAMSMAANLTAVAIENVRLLRRESNAREAAEESNRLKDEFLATVSHELRTPLTAILGWSRLLDSESLEDTVAKQAIETIWRNAKAQSQIIDDILDVSRIITGNLYLDLHPVELGPVVENAVNVVRPTADAKGIRIESQLDNAPAVVSGDENRLQQVIWNLLSNAVKFTNSGGRVLLQLSQLGSEVEIKVTDTGQGISREFLPFVFDRFRQADSSTTRQHGGLGLGLAIARHLMEIHGGSIQAESEGKGKGSSFTIRLPLLDSKIKTTAEMKGNATALSNQQSLSGLHVLVVDDDADTLELLTTALTSRKADVTAVGTAGEAIEVIKGRRPDVLVSDIAMPEEDGYGLIAKVRSLDGAGQTMIPAVAITAYAKEEDRQRALASGFQIYLAKPVELSELISVVARAAKRDY